MNRLQYNISSEPKEFQDTMFENDIKSCCFTGHRMLSDEKDLKLRLEKELLKLIESGVNKFYAGGAVGWDTLCAETVLELKDTKYPHISLHLILPCPENEQTSGWNIFQKLKYKQIIKKADTVKILSDKYYDGCMKARNQSLVNNADICVCCYNIRKSASGTGQTVRMAQKKGILVLNLFEN